MSFEFAHGAYKKVSERERSERIQFITISISSSFSVVSHFMNFSKGELLAQAEWGKKGKAEQRAESYRCGIKKYISFRYFLLWRVYISLKCEFTLKTGWKLIISPVGIFFFRRRCCTHDRARRARELAEIIPSHNSISPFTNLQKEKKKLSTIKVKSITAGREI